MFQDTQTLEVIVEPGYTGLQIDPRTGEVLLRIKDAQNVFKVVSEGYFIISLDGEPFSERLFQQKCLGGENYVMKFEFPKVNLIKENLISARHR